jgi:hypothetical protein
VRAGIWVAWLWLLGAEGWSVDAVLMAAGSWQRVGSVSDAVKEELIAGRSRTPGIPGGEGCREI